MTKPIIYLVGAPNGNTFFNERSTHTGAGKVAGLQAIPQGVEETVQTCLEMVQAGASVLHIHMRDEEGKVTGDGRQFAEVFRRVREQHPNVQFSMTTSKKWLKEYIDAHRDDPYVANLIAGHANPELSPMRYAGVFEEHKPDIVPTITREAVDNGDFFGDSADAKELRRYFFDLFKAAETYGVTPEIEIQSPKLVDVVSRIQREGLAHPETGEKVYLPDNLRVNILYGINEDMGKGLDGPELVHFMDGLFLRVYNELNPAFLSVGVRGPEGQWSETIRDWMLYRAKTEGTDPNLIAFGVRLGAEDTFRNPDGSMIRSGSEQLAAFAELCRRHGIEIKSFTAIEQAYTDRCAEAVVSDHPTLASTRTPDIALAA
jgi:uncharacterized protein (DUF849 family)